MATPAFDNPPPNHSSNTLLKAYETKKERLLQQYKELLKIQTNGLGLKKETSNLFRTRVSPKKRLDVRHFNRVLSCDANTLISEVEGMTTYEDIVKETLKYGCLPTVVPELKTITIGGALSGGGIESSSFKYGLVHETILEYEILLGDGRVVVCRPDNEHRDLYYGFPNTYGTLGYALKVKVKLIPAKNYVKMTHHYFDNSNDFFKSLWDITQKNRNRVGDLMTSSDISFVEGVIFDNKTLYITTGEFVDQAPFHSDYTYLHPYYQSIRSSKNQTKIDFLTSHDYIWRWDTDWFWCSKHFYMNHFLMRLLFGKYMLNSKRFWKMRNFFNKHETANNFITWLKGRSESVIQDVEIPIDNAEAFLKFFSQHLNIWPIWVCPTQQYQDKPYDFYRMDPKTLYINFGFWDTVPSNQPDGYYNKLIEAKVTELGGNKSLYSNVFYTQEEFWKIFDRNQYQTLKTKYDPNHRLKDLYNKTSEKR